LSLFAIEVTDANRELALLLAAQARTNHHSIKETEK